MSTHSFAKTCALIVLAGVFVVAALPADSTPGQISLGTIDGTVVDEEGNPLAGVTLQLEDRERGRTFTFETTEDGSFFGRSLFPGTYFLVVHKEGHTPYEGQLRVRAGAELRGIKITLAKPRTVENTVAEHFQQGIAHYNEANYDEAIESFEKVIELVPDSFEAHADLGMAYLATSRFENAVETLERAVELDPEVFQPRVHLALAYSHLNRLEPAREILENVLAEHQDLADPTTFQATVDLGNVYFASGSIDRAIETFEKALTAQPESPEPLNGLAKCYLRKNEAEKALELFEKVVTVAPDSPQAEEARAFIEALKGSSKGS